MPFTSDNGVIENFEEPVDRLPEYVDDLFPDHCQLKMGGPNEGGKPTVRLQCEDYGGDFCLPWYGSQRPCIGYHLTNLTIYMFVILILTSVISSVYLYDERAMGKNADALCSLRFVYHMRLFVEARVSETLLSSPDTLYVVMNNCVGQNKSQVVMIFMLLLSMTLYKKVVCDYLVSGHSHMCPDRVVSHAKNQLVLAIFMSHEDLLRK